jgi:hypothetical protein
MNLRTAPAARAVLLAAMSLLGLAACGDRGTPGIDAEPPAPVVQNNQIRFAPDHPQLRLLTVAAATPGESGRNALPARIVSGAEVNGVPRATTADSRDAPARWVLIDASESEAVTLPPGTPFRLEIASLPGQSFEGRVVVPADSVDTAGHTIRARGLVPDADRRLQPGMAATARFGHTLGAGVVVPASALILRNRDSAVLVQVQPGVFEIRTVHVGFTGPSAVVVSGGLEAGERVVSENALLLWRELRLAQETAAAATEASFRKPRNIAASAAGTGKP